MTDREPRREADERFVHGLLSFLHEDDRDRQGERVQRVMETIGVEADRRRRTWRPALRWGSVAFAAAAIVILVLMLAPPGERSAYAIVQATIDASSEAGERRYEIAVRGADVDATPESFGVLDVRDPEHFLMRATGPDGRRLVVGHDDVGEWAIRRDGGIERLDPRQAWPRWGISSGSLVESVDVLLRRLADQYTLDFAPPDDDDDPHEGRFERIVATSKEDPRGHPERFEVWIDPASLRVERMEMHWSPEAAGDRSQRRDGREPRGDRPPRRDGPPRGDGPPPRDRRGPPPGDGRRDGPGREEGGRRPGPPTLVVFQRVETPAFDGAWFDPQTHVEDDRSP